MVGIATTQQQRLKSLANPRAYQPGMVDAPAIADPGSLAPTMMRAPDLTPGPIERPGLFDRIGMELDKPGVRAALLRSGMATFNGGLGEGMKAADAFLNQRAQNDLDQQRIGMQGRGLDIQQQGVAQTGAHYERSDTNEALRDAANATYQGGQLAIQRGNQRLQWGMHTEPSGDARLRAQTDMAQWTTPSANAQLQENGQMTRWGTPSADQRLQSDTSLGVARIGAGIGSRARIATITNETPAEPASNGFFGIGASDAVPKTTTQTDVLPMPASQDQAVVGAVYATSKGPMRWTGQTFVAP
jgi:hypothetical protein